MGTIVPFLRDGVFDPHDIKAMSMALDDVCEALKLREDSSAEEVIAARIIDLARTSESEALHAFVTECFTRRAWPNTSVLVTHCAESDLRPRPTIRVGTFRLYRNNGSIS